MILQDRQVLTLYNLARYPGEELISHDQQVAIGLLGSLAYAGNTQAAEALQALVRWPNLHPLLRELAAAEAGVPVPGNT